jgi:isoleucyl-tRNA synthetase
MSEITYQNLSKCLPPSKEDTRSVHFVSFPEVKKEYFNANVERSVGRMQAVIELGRFIRDQKNISLKTPCRELIIVNPDPEYRKDIKSLESYIQEELNIRNVIVTAEENAYGVNYKLVPDAKALGVKYKKDASKIRNALGSVSKDDIKEFVNTGTLEVAGFTLTAAEVQVTRTFDNSNENFHAHFTNEVLVILNTELDESLVNEGLAREVVNRVQRLRKKAGLEPTDDVLYYYTITEDADSQLQNILDTQVELLRRYLKQDLIVSPKKEIEVTIIEEEQEVNGAKFILHLAKQ